MARPLAAITLATALVAGAGTTATDARASEGDIRAAYMAAVEQCLDVVARGQPFEQGALQSRDDPINLAAPRQKQSLWPADGHFIMRLGTLAGREDSVLRTCGLKERGTMPRGALREAIQADLRALVDDLVATGDYIALSEAELPYKPHPDSLRAVSCDPNPRGCRVRVTLMLPSGWLEADFGEFECVPIPAEERRPRYHFPQCSAPEGEGSVQ